jgi:acyl-CoA thioester hydrolase
VSIGAVAAAADPGSYRFWATEHVRFADLDLMGHVNNKAFTVYAESGRVAFLGQTGLWVADSRRQNMIVRLELDYLRELHYPSAVRIGVRVLKIGRTSFTLGLGIFGEKDCVAVATTVMVRIDNQTRASLELNADERTILEPYLAIHAAARLE